MRKTSWSFALLFTLFFCISCGLTTQDSFLITFDSNGGNEIESVNAPKGSTILLPTATKLGYTFGGWFTSNAFVYDFTMQTAVSSNATLYAKWNIVPYSISYEYFGGTLLAGNPSSYDIEDDTIHILDPEKTGYSFEGWYDNPSLTGNAISSVPAGSTGDIHFYSKWAILQYTVTFFVNQGSEINPITQDFNSIISPPTDPIRSGYQFTGWFEDENLETSYSFGTMPSENISVYAGWDIENYIINYYYDGGTIEFENQNAYTVEDVPFTLSSPVKIGYSFAGWYSNAEYSSQVFSEISNGQTGDLTLYAKWIINEYTISFISNSGSAVEPITLNYETSVTPPVSPIRTGFAFFGWYIDSDLTEQYFFTSMPAHNIVLYAKWEIVIYSITYNLLGGNIQIENPANYTVETDTFILNSPIKTGYTFSGWFQNVDFNGDDDDSIHIGWTGDLVFYAKWDINQYTISFDVQDGSFVSPISLDYGQPIVSPPNPIKSGYHFIGWYQDENLLNPYSFSVMPGNNITLYAKWLDYIVGIDAMRNSSFGITSTNRILMWGSNWYSEYYCDGIPNSNTACDITSQFNLYVGETIEFYSVGGAGYSFATTSLGRVFAWGNNVTGQLGDGTTTFHLMPIDITSRFSLAYGEKIVSIQPGFGHSMAVTSTGRIFSWGDNQYGQLGDGTTTNRLSPTLITNKIPLYGGETVTKLIVCTYYNIVYTSANRVFSWGYNNVGQLGDGTTITALSPKDITPYFALLGGETIHDIYSTSGGSLAYALTSYGRLFGWGHSSVVIGLNSYEAQLTPTLMNLGISLNSGESIVNISVGFSHFFALTSSGRVFAWGANEYGQLGDGTLTRRNALSTAIEITPSFNLLGGESIISIMAGDDHSFAITSTGRYYAWGKNSSGQLGDGTYIDKLSPTLIELIN